MELKQIIKEYYERLINSNPVSSEHPAERALRHVESVEETETTFQSYPLLRRYKSKEEQLYTINLVGFTDEYSPTMIEFTNEHFKKGEIRRRYLKYTDCYGSDTQLNLHLLNNIISLDSIGLLRSPNKFLKGHYISLEQITFKEGLTFHPHFKSINENEDSIILDIKKDIHNDVTKKMLNLFLKKIYHERNEENLFYHYINDNHPNKRVESDSKFFSIRRNPDMFSICGYNILVQSPEIIPTIDDYFKEKDFEIINK